MTVSTGGEPEGLLLVDKPSGPTSHDVVGRARAVLGLRRVGHAGTLDPMATGLLVLGVGRATKLLGHLALTDKQYTATIRLGVRTTTDDADGEILARRDASAIAAPDLAAAMAALTGDLMQVPSSVSAIKVDGRRAYARVRAGEDVTLDARAVTVTRFEPTGPPRRTGGATDTLDVDVLVDCSTGTYIRALARDLGEALGVGGHLTALRRVRVGPFDVADATDLFPDGARPSSAGAARRPAVPDETRPPRPPVPDDLRARIAGAVMPVARAARQAFAGRELDPAQAADLAHGRPVSPVGIDGVYAAYAPDGELLALLAERGGAARPVLVWRPAG